MPLGMSHDVPVSNRLHDAYPDPSSIPVTPPGGRFARGVGWLAAAIGLFVLLAWVFGLEALKTPVPYKATMQPITALGILLAGLALVVLASGFRTGAVVGGGAVLALATQTLVQCVFGIDLGTDRLLFPTEVDAIAIAHPGRMAPATAAGFLLFGISLLLKCRRRNTGAVLAVLGLLLTCVPLLGYLYAADALYTAGPYLTMAVHTAASLAILFVGVLAVCPPDWVKYLGSRSPGGMMARRLIPAIVGVPVAAGWLALDAADKGFFPERLATALVVLATTIMLTLVAVRYAARVAAADAARRDSYERLRLAVEGARLGTWEMDLRTGMAAGSARFAEMFGLAGEEAFGNPGTLFAHLRPDDRERALATVRSAAQGQVSNFQDEYRVRHPDGSWRWIATQGRILDGAVGRPGRALGIARDVTERKLFEERQELLLREVNHRVKNSLQLVNALLGMQAHQIADGETRRQFEEDAARIRAVAHLHERL
jgi:PAS domain S-box-containing protein